MLNFKCCPNIFVIFLRKMDFVIFLWIFFFAKIKKKYREAYATWQNATS